MSNRHFFISYSTTEAQDFAIKLHDELESGYPKLEAWLDKRDLRPGEDWDDQIDDAIRDCGALLFVMTPDSVMSNSVCKLEWSRALSYKKTVILLFLQECETPFRLQNRQYIKFQDFSAGIAELRNHLEWVNSPAGELKRMQNELEDIKRQMSRSPEDQIPRLKKAMADLEERIKEQEFVVNHPEEAAERTEKSVEAAIQRARQPKDKPKSGTKFINHPPATVPSYFKDRYSETGLLINFVNDARHRVFHLVGRAGIGKTAVTVRLLKHLEGGKLPDENGEMSVDGIVYLSQVGSRTLKTEYLYPDLCRLLPDETAEKLDALYREPKTSTADKMKALLSHFPPEKRVLVLLDNFEDVVNHETQEISDSELDEALRALVDAPPHGVKVLITTRVLANKLYLYQTQRQGTYTIGEGLSKPYAEDMLREMDVSGTLGLKDAPEEKLSEAADKVRRYPRALEALVGWMEVDVTTTLDDVLNFAEGLLPENVVEELVARAFNRLDTSAQQVIQGLAIFGRPVSSGAVDALLKPYKAGINSAPVLRRLLNWHFVRQEHGLYTLHPVDRTYALGLIPRGEDSDRFEAGTPPFTQIALYNLGAEYFKTLRKPREEWKTIADLEPQLAEFDLRCNAGDWDTAAEVLFEIDYHYLHLWGYYKLMIELHERLQGNIFDEWLSGSSVGNLGLAYHYIGDVYAAIKYYNEALSIARGMNNKADEGVWLGNLGNAYSDLGKSRTAIDYYQQALKIARTIGDKRNEGVNLSNLGSAYNVLGDIRTAIDYYQQALKIAQIMRDKLREGIRHGNLGERFMDLGEIDKASNAYRLSIEIAKELGDKFGISINLGNQGLLLMSKNDWASADEHFQNSIAIADEIDLNQIQHYARWGLALLRLYQEDLANAKTTIEACLIYDLPENNHNAHVLRGMIILRQGDTIAARQSFENALQVCDELLAMTPELYEVKDAKGLALCGLAVVENNPARVEEAKVVFREVRSYTADLKGHIGRVQRQFDALAKADEQGLLVGVREVIGGE